MTGFMETRIGILPVALVRRRWEAFSEQLAKTLARAMLGNDEAAYGRSLTYWLMSAAVQRLSGALE
jgi:predicted P-loop ATPase